ncbi:MAG: ATP-dependent helicase C-terminal domain-containing protein, partial [Myxococcota bacterium]
PGPPRSAHRTASPAPPVDETSEVLFAELDKRGLVALFSEESIEHSLGRLEVAARTGISLSASNAEEALLRAACAHATTIDEVRNRELDRLLHTVVDPAAVGTFEQRVPRAVELPSGRTLKVHYARGRGPWIESYLQDFFGMPETPRAGGEPVTVHLWAPNRRPVQVTTDLASFWTQAYPELKRSLSRRYPKHVWPDDPRRADPTRLKRHLGKN